MVQKLPASSNSRFRPSLRAKGVIIFVVVVVRRDQPTFSPPFVFLSLLSACYDDRERERERERFEQSVVVLHSRVVILGARKKDEAFASTKKKEKRVLSSSRTKRGGGAHTKKANFNGRSKKSSSSSRSKVKKGIVVVVFVVRSLLFYLIERSKKKHTLLFKWSRLVQKSLVHSLSFKKEYSTHISTSINRAHIKKREN